VTIIPAADGWRVDGLLEGETARTARTMQEVAAELPDGAKVNLSLPVGSVLMERMRLPSIDREELAGMVVLQLEKTVPYSGDELTSGFDIITQDANECDLLAAAVSNGQLNELCEPLRKRRMLPEQVSVFSIQFAARFPEEEVLALVFRELDATILAVAVKGKLVAAHACTAAGREDFLAELPRLLLAAELEGAPVNFTKVVVEWEMAEWLGGVGGLKDQFDNVPVLMARVDGSIEPGPVNLVPAEWIREQRQLLQTAKVRDWLSVVGVILKNKLLAAATYIIWMKRQVQAIESQVSGAESAVNAIADHRARWNALAPATDPTQYPVEILHQITRSITKPEVHVTLFQYELSKFELEGEAPTATMASDYLEALKANPDLKAFTFDASQPGIEGPDLHAHFRIFARL
jgi:hypothetical protein